MSTPPVRSWSAEVRKADRDFDQERLRPVAYRFSNDREFRDRPDPYAVSTSTAS